jgi:hypothetical protein
MANANKLIGMAFLLIAGYCLGGMIGLGLVALFIGVSNLL